LGGLGNKASGVISTAMGDQCTASGIASTAMGAFNMVGGNYSTVMGNSNTVNGSYSTAMGSGCTAGGDYSFAAGFSANAAHAGSFVWADDSSLNSFSDTGGNQFRIRAKGGVQVVSGGLAVTGASSPNYPGTSGVYLENSGSSGDIYAFNYNTSTTMPLQLNSPGGNVGVGSTAPTHLFQVGNAYCDGNTWAPSSDRNLKAGFQPVDVQAVLSKVAALPITSWHYTNDISTSHVGPMAQDFYQAFNVGADDKHITTTDENGVELAAIQGLNQKLDEKDAQIQNLEKKLDELQTLVKQLAEKK